MQGPKSVYTNISLCLALPDSFTTITIGLASLASLRSHSLSVFGEQHSSIQLPTCLRLAIVTHLHHAVFHSFLQYRHASGRYRDSRR